MKPASQILADNIALVLDKSQHSANAAGKKSGVGQTTISNWIRKSHDADPKFNPRVEQLEAFARAFGYTVADLFRENLGNTPSMAPEPTAAPYASAISHATSPEVARLIERYLAADPATRALIDLALGQPSREIPQGLSDSLATLVASARDYIAKQIKAQ